jgi:hypothetical protein
VSQAKVYVDPFGRLPLFNPLSLGQGEEVFGLASGPKCSVFDLCCCAFVAALPCSFVSLCDAHSETEWKRMALICCEKAKNKPEQGAARIMPHVCECVTPQLRCLMLAFATW